ncbi:MAG: RluA family pseudouridine synthase [Planctomycetes bacterium]|nr:RluA family pseudouridine synthase [Planctomycetota bacterium]
MSSDRAPPANPLLLRSRVPADAHHRPLHAWLCGRFPYLDDAGWRAELAAGRVFVDDRRGRADDRLLRGQSVVWHKVQPEPFAECTMPVLHEDDAIIAIDKPAHLPMHADGPFVRHTVVQLLRERLHCATLDLVHRLDRETSGVVVLAKTKAAAKALLAQFAASKVAKNYVAVVLGHVAADFTVDLPIGRSANSSIALRRAAGPAARDARPARTDCSVLQHGPAATLLRCVPHEGRTHQIRVHLEAAGHPVLGDKLYGRSDADYLAFVQQVKQTHDARIVASDRPNRQLLHAERLALEHPTRGGPVEFTAPIPAVFAEWLARPATGTS